MPANSSNNTFLIPLAKNANGSILLNDIWKHIYGSNEEKTNRFNVEFVKSTVSILLNNVDFEKYIIMARLPISLRDECSIAMKCDGMLYEYIYIPNETKYDKLKVDYITNTEKLSQITNHFMKDFKIKKFNT